MGRINPYKKFNGIHIPEGLTKIPVSQLSHGAKVCYGRLARYAGENGFCYPKIETLAKEIGVERRAVGNYIEELKKFGLIETKRRGLNKSNYYFFLDNVVLRDALTNSLIDADKDISEVQDGADNKESHLKDSQIKEGKNISNPDGLSSLSNPDKKGKSMPIQPIDLGKKKQLEEDVKELIHNYRKKISQSYDPQITSETTGLIKRALEMFTKEELLEGIDRYSENEWWMAYTAQNGIDWYFGERGHLTRFMYLRPVWQSI